MAAKTAVMTGWALLLVLLASSQRWAAARQLLQEQVGWKQEQRSPSG